MGGEMQDARRRWQRLVAPKIPFIAIARRFNGSLPVVGRRIGAGL